MLSTHCKKAKHLTSIYMLVDGQEMHMARKPSGTQYHNIFWIYYDRHQDRELHIICICYYKTLKSRTSHNLHLLWYTPNLRKSHDSHFIMIQRDISQQNDHMMQIVHCQKFTRDTRRQQEKKKKTSTLIITLLVAAPHTTYYNPCYKRNFN